MWFDIRWEFDRRGAFDLTAPAKPGRLEPEEEVHHKAASTGTRRSIVESKPCGSQDLEAAKVTVRFWLRWLRLAE